MPLIPSKWLSVYFQLPPLLPVHPVLIFQSGFGPLLADYHISVRMHLFLFLFNFFQIFSLDEENYLITFHFYYVFSLPPTKPPSPNYPLIAPDVCWILCHSQTGSKQTKAMKINNLLLIPHFLHIPRFSDLPLANTTCNSNVHFILLRDAPQYQIVCFF